MRRPVHQIVQGVLRHGFEVLTSANTEIRATMLVDEYRARRRSYQEKARQAGLHYDHARVRELTLKRLLSRGCSPEPRAVGDVHTLAFFPLISWHARLLRPLSALGPLSHFDDVGSGLDLAGLQANTSSALQTRQRVCKAFEDHALKVSRERKVDWVFTYAAGMELPPDTIDRVREITGAPVVGMCLDDRQSWEGFLIGDHLSGQIHIAPRLDLAWTSARVACEWYMVEGGNPIFLAEGCDPEDYCPGDQKQDIDICFVGQAYGFRAPFIAKLRSLGLRVHAAGHGWPGGAVSDGEMLALLRRSKIVLGLGGIGWSQQLKNMKGRDFDVPAIGTAVYLASYNPELADVFHIGREIVCFSSEDECLELAQRLLADDNRRLAIARAGRDRCVREHTWSHRFGKILNTLGIVVG